ncbi:MAG: hypothetical protein COV35_00770 [Alphaproteobacteria bacterium CG11_big_fil_rev_8_21_14_0_20_39_49]|nr:MAG: hypothetical protein COV35_00770 [Alphaproteobacteria bacterium CG11_big_fil_rev_8_21_14_0_20_39_49]
MMYFVVKVVITAFIVAAVSELARRYTLWAALLTSLPLISILAFTWVYFDTHDTGKIIELSHSVFWLVFPSLAFFLILPFLIKQGLAFPAAMTISIVAMAALYGGGIFIHKFITQS